MKTAEQQLAKGLGWFSAGLGVASLVAPGRLSRMIGLRDTPGTVRAIRAVGVQELTAAGGIFQMGRPAPHLWARVSGDVLHLSLLGRALAKRDASPARIGAAVAAVAGVGVLDLVAARKITRSEGGALEFTTGITINARPDEVYRRWRDLEALPSFMWHLEEVRDTGGGRSHWVARGPAGTRVEWDAEIVDDVPGERLSWRSVDGARVANRGTVRFAAAPGGQGTEVVVELQYSPPAGGFGATVAKVFGEEPQQQAKDDLRRFKQLVETGHVVRSDGSPFGTRTQNQWHQQDAQPMEEAS